MGTEYKCNATESSFHNTTAGAVPNLDNLKTHFKNFTRHLDYRTLNNQLKDALNLLLENKRAIVKSYVTQTQVVTKEHLLTTTTHLDSDIFNGSIPYKVLVFALHRDNFNGTVGTNSTQIQWEGITDFQFTINGTAVGLCIKNSKQDYWHLRNAIHKGNDKMPFTYDQYESDFGIIGVELCATNDSNLKVLPLKPEGNLSCSITFTQNAGVNIILYYVGYFPNQYNNPLDTVPFMTYAY